ncbi:hypothetical protein ACJIZ3_021466 [Penstemon smallii]|uniref:X8 domain-containing protein n=1 Tax=Penstemon smallii TaxID=265156 RepID=A0ABD3SLH8_9LAMI
MDNPKHFSFVLLLTVNCLLPTLISTDGPFVGVNIRTDVSNLLSSSDLVAFLQLQKITQIRLYVSDPEILKALAKTKIRVIVTCKCTQQSINGLTPVLTQLSQFLSRTQSLLRMNLYPYDVFVQNKGVHVFGRSGTPLHPEITSSVYVYELFNEDLRSPPISEANWGLSGSGNDTTNQTYCVANVGVDVKTLHTALDWACGPGRANCSEIQPGESWRSAGSCDFKGITLQEKGFSVTKIFVGEASISLVFKRNNGFFSLDIPCVKAP